MSTSPWALAAKNIKKELKEHFPETKFRVSSKVYSMGSSVYVHWTDGPTTKEVDEIINKYQYGWFDGMYDIYEMRENFDGSKGSAKYVSSCREISPEYREFAENHVKDVWGDNLDRWHFDRQVWDCLEERGICA